MAGRRGPDLDAGTTGSESGALAPWPGLGALAATLGLMAAAAGMAGGALGLMTLPEATLPMGFLVAVLVSAVAFGFWCGMLAAILGFVALNFLFTEPLYTFAIRRPEDLFTLSVFLIVAALAGLLAGRLHDRAEAARARAEALAILADLGRDLSAAPREAEVLAASQAALARLAGAARLVTPETLSALPPEAALMAERCMATGQAQPAALQPPGDSFLPLSPRLALAHPAPRGPRLLAVTALAEQTRAALTRLALATQAREAERRAEAEAVRSAVLTSLSHDLRTPLATILGAATALQDLGAQLPAPARADLVAAIGEEAGRLDRHVANLLHLSRLELGAPPRLDWADLADLCLAAATRARRAFPGARIELAETPLPMIRTEGVLVEQALFNLIANALAHGQPPVRLTWGQGAGTVWVQVADQGPGLPEPLALWLAGPDLRPAPGQRGLGLAVAKGIARHLGGTLTASPALTFSLPA